MSEVHVPFGDKPQETATLLLAAAEDTETPVHLVRVVDGGFKVPQEVADSAGLDHTDEYEREDSALRLGDDAPDEIKDDRMLPADHDPEDNTVTASRPGPAESAVEGTEEVPDNNDPPAPEQQDGGLSSGKSEEKSDDPPDEPDDPPKRSSKKSAAKKES